MHTLRLYSVFAFTLLALGAGCAHSGRGSLGTAVQQDTLPQGTPDAGTLLADLAANDAGIQQFRASGKFILKSPQLQETLLLPQSSITFRRPSDLCVTGRKMGSPVGRLTCVGEEFLLEVATKHEYLQGARGARFDSVSREVSPADIARETFLPEDWSALGPERVRMTGYDAAGQRATFEVLDARGRKAHRRVEVTGPPWVVRRSELLDADGVAVAITTKDDYRDNAGARFPAEIRSEFPGENAFMEFSMKSFTLNETVDPAMFDIPARLDEIQARDYVPMESSGPTAPRGNGGRLK